MQPLLLPCGCWVLAAVSHVLHLPWSLYFLGLLSLSRARLCENQILGSLCCGQARSPLDVSHKQRDPTGSLKPPSWAELCPFSPPCSVR